MAQWGRYIKVNPAEIRTGATAAEEIGDTLRKQVDFARTDSRSASAANEGFETSGALGECQATWEENWRRLAESVSGVSERLARCADTYEESDQVTARRFADIIATGRLG